MQWKSEGLDAMPAEWVESKSFSTTSKVSSMLSLLQLWNQLKIQPRYPGFLWSMKMISLTQMYPNCIKGLDHLKSWKSLNCWIWINSQQSLCWSSWKRHIGICLIVFPYAAVPYSLPTLATKKSWYLAWMKDHRCHGPVSQHFSHLWTFFGLKSIKTFTLSTGHVYALALLKCNGSSAAQSEVCSVISS